MRLIDADVADKWMRQNNAFIDAAILKAIPTIDAVPVVRCRECKHLNVINDPNMRELLFRGFHPCDGPDTIVVDGEKVKGKWVEGYIVKHPSAIQIGNDYSPWYIHVPPVDPDDNGGVFNVLPSSVGQYTGLTDKNGKRIFEGDIVTTDLKRPYLIVEFRDACFMFNCNDGDKDYYDIFLPITNTAHTEYQYGEVIGTVFDEEAQHDN